MNFQIGDVVTVKGDEQSRSYMREWSFMEDDIDWLIGKPLPISAFGEKHAGQACIYINFGDLRPPRTTIRAYNFPEKALELYTPVDPFQSHYL